MSYKNDHLVVIINKYGKSRSDAVSELYETYDKLRDITVGGPSLDGSGYGPASKFLMGLSRLLAPSAFMPILGNDTLNIPGTSFFSSAAGSNSIVPTAQSAFGASNLAKYSGFPAGGAASINMSSNISSAIGTLGLPLLMGIGNTLSSLSSDFTVGGMPTGGASTINTLVPMAGAVSGVATGATQPRGSLVIPVAGILSGVGSLVSSVAPYFGPFGLAGGLMGNLLNGYAGAVLSGYQAINAKILNNADVIMQSKVRNIETVVKQIDTQSEVLRKMLKDAQEFDKQALQEFT